MGFLRRRAASRFPAAGRVADVVLVSSTALRFANRRGWVSDDLASKFGAPDSSGGSGVSAAELAMAGAAAFRLARRFLGSRKAR